MEGVYQWVSSILCFLIFVYGIKAMLPSKKYEKYIRFFTGMILILLVIQPVMGGLNLEDRLAYYFENISFQRESEDLKREILGIESKRLERVIEEYEGAVERDVKAMAEGMGFRVERVEVSIEKEQEAQDYGTVTHIRMVLGREEGRGEWEEEEKEIGEKIRIGDIEIEPVEVETKDTAAGEERTERAFEEETEGAFKEETEGALEEETKGALEEETDEAFEQGTDGTFEQETDKAFEQELKELRRRVEQYYGLESWNVEVEFKRW